MALGVFPTVTRGRECDELERCAILSVAVESPLRWKELIDEFSCEDVVAATAPEGSR